MFIKHGINIVYTENESDALSWSNDQTAKTGDIYSIECEDAC